MWSLESSGYQVLVTSHQETLTMTLEKAKWRVCRQDAVKQEGPIGCGHSVAVFALGISNRF